MPFLFWIFAAMMLGFALMVVLHPNPVASALSLVVCFVALAALFVTLQAFFIGVIQILVYAGAVMVLFLFIIMLLDLKAEETRKINPAAMVAGSLISAGLAGIIVAVIQAFPEGNVPFPEIRTGGVDDVREVGMALFTHFNPHLQIIGALVLVATVGVVILSKRELK